MKHHPFKQSPRGHGQCTVCGSVATAPHHTKRVTKAARELALLRQLCTKHGYTFLEQPRPKDRTNMAINLRTGEASTLREFRVVVPMTSALAAAKPLDKRGEAALRRNRTEAGA